MRQRHDVVVEEVVVVTPVRKRARFVFESLSFVFIWMVVSQPPNPVPTIVLLYSILTTTTATAFVVHRNFNAMIPSSFVTPKSSGRHGVGERYRTSTTTAPRNYCDPFWSNGRPTTLKDSHLYTPRKRGTPFTKMTTTCSDPETGMPPSSFNTLSSSSSSSTTTSGDRSIDSSMVDLYTNVAIADPQWFDEHILPLLYHDTTNSADRGGTIQAQNPHYYHDGAIVNANFVQYVEQQRRHRNNNNNNNSVCLEKEHVDALESVPPTAELQNSTRTETSIIIDDEAVDVLPYTDDEVDSEDSKDKMLLSSSTTLTVSTAPTFTSVVTTETTRTTGTTSNRRVEGKMDDLVVEREVLPTSNVSSFDYINEAHEINVPAAIQPPPPLRDTVQVPPPTRVVPIESPLWNTSASRGTNNTTIFSRVMNATSTTTFHPDNVTSNPAKIVPPMTMPVNDIKVPPAAALDGIGSVDDPPDEISNATVVRGSNENITTASNSEPRRVILYYYDDDEEEQEEEDAARVDVVDRTTRTIPWQQVPLSTVQDLGYTESDIVQLLPTALHIIISDRIRKPRRPLGIPHRWRQTTTPDDDDDDDDDEEQRDVHRIQIIAESDVDEILQTKLQNSITSKQHQPSKTDEAPMERQRQGPEVGSERTSSSTSKSELQSDTKGHHNGTPPSTNPNFLQNRTVASNTSVNHELRRSRTFIADGTESVFVESPPRTRNDPGISIGTATAVKSTILPPTKRDGTPSQELPQHRRSSSSSDHTNSVEVPSPSSLSERRKRRPSTEAQEMSSSSPPNQRTVYNGRSATRPRRRDSNLRDLPPPPKSGIWPDVDTFQKLLRDEATFRLRLLGNDWTDIVKEEIDWRNDLYTNWLYTLHNGIGEPFVQSRSDRMRRQRRQQQQQPQDPRPRSETSKSTTKRPK